MKEETNYVRMGDTIACGHCQPDKYGEGMELAEKSIPGYKCDCTCQLEEKKLEITCKCGEKLGIGEHYCPGRSDTDNIGTKVVVSPSEKTDEDEEDLLKCCDNGRFGERHDCLKVSLSDKTLGVVNATCGKCGQPLEKGNINECKNKCFTTSKSDKTWEMSKAIERYETAKKNGTLDRDFPLIHSRNEWFDTLIGDLRVAFPEIYSARHQDKADKFLKEKIESLLTSATIKAKVDVLKTVFFIADIKGNKEVVKEILIYSANLGINLEEPSK